MHRSSDPRPRLLLLADDGATRTASDLFGSRGFVVLTTPSYVDVAVLDFHHRDARAVARVLRADHPHVPVIGIVSADQLTEVQHLLDAAFAPPVDRARLFVRVVELVASRKHGHHATKITGVVGVIRGNLLFQRALEQLHRAVHPVNAGAVLERSLQELDASADSFDEADLEALLASGRLQEALAGFGDEIDILDALTGLAGLLSSHESQLDPGIPVRPTRSDEETTHRTCG